jgi:hypothetical protein
VFPLLLLGVKFSFDFRVRQNDKAPHESCELAEIARDIVAEGLGLLASSNVSVER